MPDTSPPSAPVLHGTTPPTPAAPAVSSSRLAVAAVYLMFFCSGMASLICEVVWFKQLQLLLGSSTLSVSVVVACFFGGLACGSWLGGRLADRARWPLR